MPEASPTPVQCSLHESIRSGFAEDDLSWLSCHLQSRVLTNQHTQRKFSEVPEARKAHGERFTLLKYYKDTHPSGSFYFPFWPPSLGQKRALAGDPWAST